VDGTVTQMTRTVAVPAPLGDQGHSGERRVVAVLEEVECLETLTYAEWPAALERAEDAELRAAAAGSAELVMRARLVQADTLVRLGQTAAGGRLARDVNRWASEHGHRYVLARSHAALARFFRQLGDRQLTLEHATASLDLTDEDTRPLIRFDHAMTLGIALACVRSYDAARERFRRAETLADAYGTVEQRLQLLNNMAYCDYEAGQPASSLAVVQRMERLAAAHGVTLQASFLDTAGRAYLEAGDPAAARDALTPVTDPAAEVRAMEGDAVASCLLTLAEAQLALGDTDDAGATLDQCQVMCAERGLGEVGAALELQRARLFAAQHR